MRVGNVVYATGRSSRASGPSEPRRPESIEETGALIAAAGVTCRGWERDDGHGIDQFR